MRKYSIFGFILFGLLFSACSAPVSPSPASQPVQPTAATSGPAVISTSLGEFEIGAIHLVDEVHDQKAEVGQVFLLLALTQNGENPALGSIPLDQIDKITHDSSTGEQVHITDGKSLDAITTMSGWVDDEFVVGFTVPSDASGLTLQWPGQDPIDLTSYMRK
jgi:hypothetical protein